MRRILCGLAIVGLLPSATLVGQQTGGGGSSPVFRSDIRLVRVDVVVRDRAGQVVKGLTAADFELREDGVPQPVQSFSFEEVGVNAAPVAQAGSLLPAVISAGAQPLTTADVTGHRLVVLVFDTSSMEPDDVQKAVDGAMTWVETRMSPADLVAVATVGSSLRVLTDFTNSQARVRDALRSLSAAEGIAVAAVDSGTAASDDAGQSATTDTTAVDASAQELDTFNNDLRLRALKTLAQALQPLQAKKALLYFSAGLQRSGTDNQVELRAAVNAAVRANVAIYPVDARGLQAVIPGGSARQASRGGLAAFSGSAVTAQFAQLAAQQETLTWLASDTGGTAFTDSNDFGEAFGRIERDISSYYILGFSSTNTKQDGRFRRVTVRVRGRSGVKVEAKDGYYADRDFAHTAKADREASLQEQLVTPIAATDLPVFLATAWFRLAADRYYVPISLAVPGTALAASDGKANPLDVAGFIRDERGLPIGQIRDTVAVPRSTGDASAARPILYQTSVALPAGRFTVKVVVRDNADGRMGTFETRLTVPDLRREPVKVSSIVLSTQLRDSPGANKIQSPLVRDGVEVVPNLAHVVGRGQTLYFFFEVYDSVVSDGAPQVQTNLAFYRGKVKVYETAVVERTHVDAADRRAEVFQFALPAGGFAPGLYTCQVNVIDVAAGRFAFPRFQMYVR